MSRTRRAVNYGKSWFKRIIPADRRFKLWYASKGHGSVRALNKQLLKKELDQ
ncbi:hypothetical protein Dxin01_00135 [Deinococcus xinjiangensis]|uniref:Uncharacterized protein n=1 Tax=Deinococcus xinjiangensis TaxID=457454 RepID=A0ABP9V5D3_9DEIO